MRFLNLPFVLCLCLPLAAQQVQPTTAWQDGHFVMDTAGVVGRSDIVLSQPNTKSAEAMPMGNGRLGISVWAADGFTAQLNRGDTLPHRDSPGQVVIPGLSALTTAADFQGRLDLLNGTLIERGGGLTLTAFVQTATDTLVVDVHGANPALTQTAKLYLWEPRKPAASVAGKAGILAQSWTDEYGPGATGEKFGALAAITATGREVSASVSGPREVTISFKPGTDGHFQIVVACPHYNGSEATEASLGRALSNVDVQEHEKWWHAFWQRAGLIKITSSDSSGEYMENLRNLYLYSAAAMSGGRFPGSQAGIADLFSAAQDVHRWDPAAYWHWNLRMQVAANINAGLPELNEPYFRLYRENLANIEDWTTKHMGSRPGMCVPETMRFNGQGIEYEADWNGGQGTVGLNCDAASPPYYNARTLSTGAEISIWIWRQYQATGDRAFLEANYPVMVASAQFLLAYETPGADGKRHTHPSNAHEQQWDTIDPTTDLSARSALFPAVMEAATLLHRDDKLVSQLKTEITQIPELPLGQKGGREVIVESHDPKAAAHNEENLGLEPVWPYNLIGDDSPMLELARSSYATRPYPVHQDWSFDPVQAARLGLGEEVRSTLIALTEHYQNYINGFANWGGPAGEFYVEQEGVVALALPEALVQDYDGSIRIAPAVPHDWNVEGSVWVRNRTRVDVQVYRGVTSTVSIEAGASEKLRIRNPWPGQSIKIVDARGQTMLTSKGSTLNLPVRKGESYLLNRSDAPAAIYGAVSGLPAAQRRTLGPVQIGK